MIFIIIFSFTGMELQEHLYLNTLSISRVLLSEYKYIVKVLELTKLLIGSLKCV